MAYFLGDPPTLSVFYPSPNSRDGSLEGADKDVFGQGTLHEVQCLLGVLMSMTHCINPRTTLNTAATSQILKCRPTAQGMAGHGGTTGIRSTPGPRSATFSLKKKTDNGHSHQRNNSARDSGLNFALQRNSNTASNTTAPHIHTPSPVVSKPA